MLRPTLEQRLALRQRPENCSPVMFQRWEKLLFLHWEIDPELIQKSLPPGLFVDCHEGKAYLAIVPFLMRKIRPRGFPAIPYISNFLECNIRTYVHDESGIPGVWFYSLDTNRWLACKIGRSVFRLPYFWASMRALVKDEVFYRVRRRVPGIMEAHYTYGSSADLVTADAGSLDFFLLERYLLYTCDRMRKRLYSCQVHHDPYRFSLNDSSEWDPGPFSWNGIPSPEGCAVHACVAERVDVEVFKPNQQLGE